MDRQLWEQEMRQPWFWGPVRMFDYGMAPLECCAEYETSINEHRLPGCSESAAADGPASASGPSAGVAMGAPNPGVWDGSHPDVLPPQGLDAEAFMAAGIQLKEVSVMGCTRAGRYFLRSEQNLSPSIIMYSEEYLFTSEIRPTQINAAQLRHMDPGQRAETDAMRSALGPGYEARLRREAGER